MSAYNQSPVWLADAVDSILGQSLADFELIIINDGSRSENSDALESHAERDSRIRLIRNHRNIGLTRSLNQAIRTARGEYIARMDSDDIALPDRFRRQLDFLNNGGYDLIVSGYQIIDEQGRIVGQPRPVIFSDLKKMLIRGNPFVHSTFFGKKIVFDELYNEEFKRAQDYELLLRFLGRGFRIGFQPECVLQYRSGESNISARRAKEQEWYAIRARWLAVTSYGFSPAFLPYIFRSLIILLLPYRLKRYLVRQKK